MRDVIAVRMVFFIKDPALNTKLWSNFVSPKAIFCRNVPSLPGCEAFGHAGKEDPVEGQNGIPVCSSKQSAGAEGGGLDELVIGDLELEPGFAGHFHFCCENQAGG
jgi:hypothetical protein